MKVYTEELTDHERLKTILELLLKLSGFEVVMNNDNGHKLFSGQKDYNSPIRTVVLRTESTYIKFLRNERNGFGKINMSDVMADNLISELRTKIAIRDRAKEIALVERR